ncbi:MAG: inhibitor of KinA [Cyclobacteriaceae bacterium]|jgi:inhibitor of KinA
MKDYQLTYRQFGTQSILVEWPQKIEPNILNDIQAFKGIIELHLSDELEEAVPAYASLTLFFKKSYNYSEVIEKLKKLYPQGINTLSNNKTWIIPVCYDKSFGIDLESLAKAHKLTVEEIIYEHSKKTYLVYFIGFLPGFLYLGGLDEQLHFPRKNTPRLQIKKGSVGIGGSQTGIYPLDSPGGWNIIGNTPISLFDKSQQVPCFAKPGNEIRFEPIDLKTHTDILAAVERGIYEIEVDEA